jgi:hypothetical protein
VFWVSAMSETGSESHKGSEAKGSVKVIDIPDLNRPLYRIFPLWFSEAALLDLGRSLVLVPPSRWEDPFFEET